MSEAARSTPMLRQYQALKQDNPDSILLFRMGDFYEMFFDDARHASALLELTLTARGKGTDNVVPMCGFPHHQLDSYTARLVKADQRVAICDQVEDPRKAKGLVKREVVRVVTPGTVLDPEVLDAKTNIWLAAVTRSQRRLGLALLDVSTGDFLAWDTEESEAEAWDRLADRLRYFAPREVVHPETWEWPEGFAKRLNACRFTASDDTAFAHSVAVPVLERQLGVHSLDGYGLRGRSGAAVAAGALLQYAQDTQKCRLEHIDQVALHEPSEFLLLDEATRRNLEIERSLRDGSRRGSLFETLDSTVTPAGGRLLRRWLLAPLLDAERIEARLDAVQDLMRQSGIREDVRDRLRRVLDIERLLTRAVAGRSTPRDLQGLCHSLQRLPDLLGLLGDVPAPLIRQTVDTLDPCDDLADRLARALVDDPPATLREGGVIRDGFNDEVDELRSIRRDGRSWIAKLEASERETTGIASLKVKYNKVFGYFIEVSKSNLHLVPERYHRKQTISTGERYITSELKDYETKVLHAQERLEELELDLFQKVRDEVAADATRLKAVARATALIDVLASLAELANERGYCRPRIADGSHLHIEAGRHPVVESQLLTERFIPNDTQLDGSQAVDGQAVVILTGPNMGGKSTYLRQVALITLMAQAGSFVPARSAQIGLVDRIFCRVGASDNLAEGQSTFMVEMAETANILNHATPRSLVLLDEIGRGTSTFDGLSIAWAVVEHLDELKGGAPRTLFATHYHELTELAVERDAVANYRMAVREHGDRVAFLHLVEAGASDRSYGIHVARLAGVPVKVVVRAEEILKNLERDEYGQDGLPRRARRDDRQERAQPVLTGLFEAPKTAKDTVSAEVLAELRERRVERLTPIEALNLLAEWQERLANESLDQGDEKTGGGDPE